MDQMIEIRPGRRIKIAISQGAPSNPTLFFIHGLGGRGYQWREQVKHLQNKYSLIVPDLLGQGDSEKPVPQTMNPYSFSELSQDVQAIFERFAGNQNFVFGHSYGGPLSTYLAVNNPSQIKKLVLIAPVSCQPYKSVPLVYLLPEGLLEMMRGYLDKSFESLAFVPGDDSELLKIEKEGRDANHMYVIKGLLAGMREIPLLDISGFQTPTLIIGGRQDKVVPMPGIEKFYSRVPRHPLVVFEQASHMVHLERSQEVNQRIDNFL